jgi:hypothetical protein
MIRDLIISILRAAETRACLPSFGKGYGCDSSASIATSVWGRQGLAGAVRAGFLRSGFGSLIAAAIFRATSRPSSVRTTCRSHRVAIDALRYRD